MSRKPKIDFEALKSSWETAIREGRVERVRREIGRLRGVRIPREHLVGFANVARRTKRDAWGLQILRPVIRPKTPLREPTRVEESAMYAALLIKLDAIPEALKILGTLDPSKHADVLLYTAYALIAQWDYPAVIPVLRRYRRSSQLTDYQRCVADMNIAASLLYARDYTQAGPLIAGLRRATESNGWNLLHANSLELAAQYFIRSGQWEEAEDHLRSAEAAAQQPLHKLFVEKWRAIMRMQRDPTDSGAVASLESVRAEAARLEHWETLRECDFFQGSLSHQPDLVARVYFGSPFRMYRRRILEIYAAEGRSCPKDYDWQPPLWGAGGAAARAGESAASPCRCFDLGSGADEGGRVLLKHGQLVHRLLITLASDFYRPFSVGRLFSRLYPDEPFSPGNASERIAHAVKQTRRWIRAHRLPLVVLVDKSRYRLAASSAFSLRVHRSTPSQAPRVKLLDHAFVGLLKAHWGHRSFSARQAAESLRISVSSARLTLRRNARSGKVIVSGRGRATRYRLET